VLSRVLAFRPASVKGRLPPGSDACPLSLRDLLPAAGKTTLPLVQAASPDVARAALVAAKVLHSALGLSLPAGFAPEPWFDAVVRAADELAAGLPLFLSAEVVVDGDGELAIERATREVWRLVEAGLTHLAFEVAEVSPEERGRVLAEVAAPVQERGLCVDIVIPVGGEPGAARRAAALLEELARRGLAVDVASVRCGAPRDAEGARAQVGALARLCAALAGVPVLRRGPVAPPLFAALRGSPVRGCEDGGVAARAAGASLDAAPDAAEGGAEVAERRARWRARAAAVVGVDELDRIEAHAYVESAEFLEALGAERSAVAVVRALERRLAEDRA
jgi:hypothetical protein